MIFTKICTSKRMQLQQTDDDVMNCLLKKIEQSLKTVDECNIFDQDSVAEELTQLISSYELCPKDWAKYVHYDSMQYTRNLIGIGSRKRFGLMILAWGPGQRSPIHDHDGSHCIMRVLKGTLIETLYNKEQQDELLENDAGNTTSSEDGVISYYRPTRETILSSGQTAYIHDKIGWHRVSNSSSEEPAVSLHLYAPPIENCRTYCEVEGKVRAQAPCPYYSMYGKKLA